MSMIQNPYAVKQIPLESETPAPKQTRWRLAPTIFLGVLGAIGLAVGLLLGGATAFNLFMLAKDPEFREYLLSDSRAWAFILGAPLLCTAWGATWIYSARCCWRRQWKRCLVSLIAGTVAIIAFVNLPVPT